MLTGIESMSLHFAFHTFIQQQLALIQTKESDPEKITEHMKQLYVDQIIPIGNNQVTIIKFEYEGTTYYCIQNRTRIWYENKEEAIQDARVIYHAT